MTSSIFSITHISTTRSCVDPFSFPLFQRNESRTVRRTDPGPAVLDGLVADAEFAEVEANHLRLDLDLVEFLAAVDSDDGTNHFGDDDHVSQMLEIGTFALVSGLWRCDGNHRHGLCRVLWQVSSKTLTHRLDEVWLLVRLRGLLGFPQLLDQAHRLPLETTVEPAASAGVDDIPKLF